MDDIIYVTGHRNPDTDSICSSIAYADLKQKMGYNAIACRLGELNPETTFVLNKFKVEQPQYIENAKCRLEDILMDEPTLISPTTTIKVAWEKITQGKNKSLFVVDQDKHLLGIVSMSNISHVQMRDTEQIKDLMKNVVIKDIAQTIQGKIIVDNINFACDGDVKIMISCNNNFCDAEYKDSIIIMSDDEQLQLKAIEKKAACLIVAEGKEVTTKVIDFAKKHHVVIITTPFDAMHVARYIYQTPVVELIMTPKVVTFKYKDYVDDVSKRMSKTRFRSYPVINRYDEVVGAVSRFHLFSYKKKKFILLDHNEVSQSVEALEVADVLEIIDHHRIGDIETGNPITFRNQNLGSTASIIYLMYKEHNLVPSKTIASLLCCAIISDTMNFNSPTSTIIDRQIGDELAQIAELNLDDLSLEMFEAVATLRGLSFSEILYNDFKEYAIEGYRIGIGQINILDVKELEVIHREFLSYMEKVNAINKYDLLLICFTNVEGKGSHIIRLGKLANIIDESFNGEMKNGFIFIPNVVSRKKQIVPTINKALKLV